MFDEPGEFFLAGARGRTGPHDPARQSRLSVLL